MHTYIKATVNHTLVNGLSVFYAAKILSIKNHFYSRLTGTWVVINRLVISVVVFVQSVNKNSYF